MAQPLVSIIVPVYNAKKHIARCLESIRRQTYENIEIILLNDGSKDVSLPVCQMYADIDKRIVLVDKANSGVSATRNLGLRLAGGKYFQFVDSDDTLEPDATRRMVEKAEEYSADLVIAHYNRVDPPKEQEKVSRLQEVGAVLSNIIEEGEIPEEIPEPKAKVKTFGFLLEGFLNKEEFARSLMEEPASFYYGVMWNKLYRADIIREHDIRCSEELSWSEDFLFNLSFIQYAERFYSLAFPVYNYVQNPASICHSQVRPIAQLKVKWKLFLYYRDLYQRLGLYEENKLQIFSYLVAGAEGLMPTTADISKGLRNTREAFVDAAEDIVEEAVEDYAERKEARRQRRHARSYRVRRTVKEPLLERLRREAKEFKQD